MQSQEENRRELVEAVNYTMPFGAHKGKALLLLPEHYLVWYHQKGFPEGKLGKYMHLMYEIKVNGLENELRPLLKSKANTKPRYR